MSTIAHPEGLGSDAAARRTPLRFVTATSLFDGHDAAIHLIRRLLVAQGAEVIHLGHNRGVEEIVRAACQEDADAVAVSSYQGGHLEFFRYLVDRLRAEGAAHIRVFGGGGATITAAEAEWLEGYGVERVYRAEDGVRLGLEAMVAEVLALTRRAAPGPDTKPPVGPDQPLAIGRALSRIEDGTGPGRPDGGGCPVIGFTGPGGAGKSTVIDELLGRFLAAIPDLRIAFIAIDPTRAKGGGALLADRLGMNMGFHPRVYGRSMATRRRHLGTSAVLRESIAFLRGLGFDLVLVETAGTGQGDTEIAPLVNLAVYVMTGEYGGPSQLEKVQMLDHAQCVVLNKRDKPGAADALRAVRDQLRHLHGAGGGPALYETSAQRFDDPGLERLFLGLCERLSGLGGNARFRPPAGRPVPIRARTSLLPRSRLHYLSEIAVQGREERVVIERQVRAARRAQGLYLACQALEAPGLPAPLADFDDPGTPDPDPMRARLRDAYRSALSALGEETRSLLRAWPDEAARYRGERLVYRVRGQELVCENYTESPSGLPLPGVALPPDEDWGALARFLLKENLPGHYPYTAGVYPRRHLEAPTRMFAGEGGPERTNRRFHYLAHGAETARLSTAFDPIVLYGEDPDGRPDVYGRLGMSGVSVATLDDVKRLYSGFDLAAPTTSVSMTINGPAPVLLAMFLNAAIDQAVEKHLRATGRWPEIESGLARADPVRPRYRGPLPAGHDGLGLALLGVSGADLVDPETYARIRADTLAGIRGTVQADVLKEDQAQNECIFALEFALSLMGDVEAFLIDNGMRHYYSVSVSGYHIGEAGADPVTQLAFTLANGFTLVEYFLARGLAIDDFAPHLSFFFSNGLDAEYAVLGRVARRIWARALRRVYGAGPRAQMLKYHVQTSGRSLQCQDLAFNDIRTTLEALYAIADNCNSLHTNAYDEAATTPTEESVRRALAIQVIIREELGQSANENPLQGSFYIEGLTDRVEEAVYAELDRLSERGGVLGAMEGLYQRARIQDQGLEYQARKHDGRSPIAGVNTFLAPDGTSASAPARVLTRASDEEKDARIADLRAFLARHAEQAPQALKRLQDAVRAGRNAFAELMPAVRHCSLGQITRALYAVGGRYRRRI